MKEYVRKTPEIGRLDLVTEGGEVIQSYIESCVLSPDAKAELLCLDVVQSALQNLRWRRH
jgi:hypothetical protein